MYPQNKNNPMGQVKLLYEAAPIAFLVANGGGQALTGLDPILELVPTSIHDRVPVFFGRLGKRNTLYSGLYSSHDPSC